MKKYFKIILIAITILLVTVLLYFVILHPLVKTYLMTTAVYEEFGGNRDIGLPITEYDYGSVTDDSLVMTDFGAFTLGIPSDWEDQTKEDSDFIIYHTIGTVTESGAADNGEGMSFHPAGSDNSDLVILDNEEAGFSAREMRHLEKGYEKLGYGMPDNAYNALKCAYSITPEDYSFLKYDESLAYAYILAYRAGSLYYSNGNTDKTYYYETDDKCVLICEKYRPDLDGKYHFIMEFYDTDDLNTGYTFSMTVDDKETGYAIINSLQFNHNLYE